MAEIATTELEEFSYKRIAVKPIAGALGAEIEGVDIADLHQTQDPFVPLIFGYISYMIFADVNYMAEKRS